MDKDKLKKCERIVMIGYGLSAIPVVWIFLSPVVQVVFPEIFENEILDTTVGMIGIVGFSLLIVASIYAVNHNDR
jgi:hypothetical protein